MPKNNPPINTFGFHYRRRFGEPVAKIALDVGVSCPNRRLGGCIYCRPESFTPRSLVKGDPLEVQIEKGKRALAARGRRLYFAYFQQETSTAGNLVDIMRAFRLPLRDPECVGLIVSTRPDYVWPELVMELAELAASDEMRDILVEMGLQSACDDTLRYLNRNHTVADFERAVSLLRRFGSITVGAHLILGLPGESFEMMLESIRFISRLGLDYVKLHHLQVIKGTRLEEIFRGEPFEVYGEERYLDLLARLLPHLPWRVVLHRLWSRARDDLLVEPHWRASSFELQARLVKKLEALNFSQGSALGCPEGKTAEFSQ